MIPLGLPVFSFFGSDLPFADMRSLKDNEGNELPFMYQWSNSRAFEFMTFRQTEVVTCLHLTWRLHGPMELLVQARQGWIGLPEFDTEE